MLDANKHAFQQTIFTILPALPVLYVMVVHICIGVKPCLAVASYINNNFCTDNYTEGTTGLKMNI